MREYKLFFYDGLAGKLGLEHYGGFPLNPFFALHNGTVITLSSLRGDVGVAQGQEITEAEKIALARTCNEHLDKYKKIQECTKTFWLLHIHGVRFYHIGDLLIKEAEMFKLFNI